ncbi:MAG: hypothetical protein M0P31_01735 [Solirubrobacteraceae bacterium]|nr:hypothetical protein [Solirubrobacteraceae bacterium]
MTAGPVRTYRGRSLEEILPRIREELGEDAVVLRRREGLAGGVGGFFQQRYVEVEAVPGASARGLDAVDDEPALPPLLDGSSFLQHLDDARGRGGARTALPPAGGASTGRGDGAPTGGLLPRAPAPTGSTAPTGPASPTGTYGRGGTIDPASRPTPAVDRDPAGVGPDPLAATTHGATPDPLATPDATPSRQAAPARDVDDFVPVELAVDVEPRVTRTTRPTDAATDAGPRVAIAGAGSAVASGVPVRPAAGRDVRGTVDADVVEYGLVARGLAPALARDVVTEALRHGVPLDPARRVDRAVRATVARRLRALDRRADVTRVAIAGGPDSDRATVVALLAEAYATAGRQVLVIGAGDAGGLRRRLAAGPAVDLLGTDDADAVDAALRDAGHDVVLVDAPVADPGDRDAIAALADRLEAAGVDEVHVAVPAGSTGPAVADVLAALEPLDPDALALTRVDVAQRPGGPIGQAMTQDLPLSYLASDDAITIAEPGRVARMVLP